MVEIESLAPFCERMAKTFARRLHLRPQDFEDLQAEVWLAVLRAIPHFREERGSVHGFFAAAIRRHLSRWLHFQRLFRTGANNFRGEQPKRLPLPFDLKAPEEREEPDVSLRQFVRLLPKLPSHVDRALVAHLLAGESVRTATRTLGLSRAALYLHRTQVLKRLRALLS